MNIIKNTEIECNVCHKKYINLNDEILIQEGFDGYMVCINCVKAGSVGGHVCQFYEFKTKQQKEQEEKDVKLI